MGMPVPTVPIDVPIGRRDATGTQALGGVEGAAVAGGVANQSRLGLQRDVDDAEAIAEEGGQVVEDGVS